MDNYINGLVTMVVKRDRQIEELHAVIVEQGMDITALQEAYEEQAQYSEVLLDIINTGYYVAGTKKELKEMGITSHEDRRKVISSIKVMIRQVEEATITTNGTFSVPKL